MQKITYLTTNQGKVDELKFHMAKNNIEIEIETPTIEILEIQSDNCLEVAKFSAQYAANILNKPVLKSDTGVYIDILGGLPGPYNTYFNKQIGVEKLLLMINTLRIGSKPVKARLQHCFAYCEPNKEPIGFEGGSEGTISLTSEGNIGAFHDFFFIPNGESHTLSYLRQKHGRDYESKFWGNAIDQFFDYYKK
jgi:XTP/dITP diphosphohydrolase